MFASGSPRVTVLTCKRHHQTTGDPYQDAEHERGLAKQDHAAQGDEAAASTGDASEVVRVGTGLVQGEVHEASQREDGVSSTDHRTLPAADCEVDRRAWSDTVVHAVGDVVRVNTE